MDPKPAVQVTAVLVLPLTEAVNWTEPCVCTVVLPGLTLTLTVGAIEDVTGAVTVTVADAEASVTALFALTLKDVLVDTEGAVSRPVLEIVPAVVYQTTAVLLVPVTVAANC